ncbi:SPOR domain-containing protein [Desulfovibrio aminophilus]|uniref:SPOR domain-containing protein n=1 Tax=Desulfovibrio aminophilus TaxID=81425 RepID=UPI00041FD16E|nr:SPOR domain-containing protein [Desulfovibrio aminophilus]
MRTVALLLLLGLLAGCSAATATQGGGVRDMLAAKDETTPLTAEQEARQGDVNAERGKPDLALISYDRALAKEPENLDYRAKKGAMLALGNMDEAALKEFQAVLTKNPDHAGANEGAGLLYLEAGLDREAEALLRKAVDRDFSAWRARNALGVLRGHRGEYAEAVRDYEAALAVHPGSAEVRNNLGLAWLMQGDAQKALGHLRAAVKTGGADARTYNNLGLALARLGREQEALEAFRYGGDEAKAMNNLGYVLLLQGDAARAAEYFQRAIEAAPSYYVTAVENLKRARMAGQFRETAPVSAPPPAIRPAATMAKPVPASYQAPAAVSSQVPARPRVAVPLKESGLPADSGAGLGETVRSSVPVPTAGDVLPRTQGERPEQPRPEVHETAPQAAAPWGVHVGSWKEEADARRYVERLRGQGIAADVCRADIPERGVWYRVLAGSYASAHEAAEARPELLLALHLDHAALYRREHVLGAAPVLAGL